MSGPTLHPAALTQAAAHWHALQRQGNVSPAQQRAFLDWLLVSPEHLREYLVISETAGALGEALRAMPDDLDVLLATPVPRSADDNVVQLPVRGAPATAPTQRRRRRLPALAAAAALVLAVGIGTPLAWPRTSHYVAAHGQPQQIRLSDDSLVHLDADSELSVRMSLFARRVELERGQASFVVAPGRRPSRCMPAGSR